MDQIRGERRLDRISGLESGADEMKIYRVKPAINDFQYFLWEPHDRSPWFKGEPIGANWNPGEPFSLYPMKPKPDIWGCGGGCIAFGSTVFRSVEKFLLKAGEVLSFTFEGEFFFALNILECLDCLDEERSTWIHYKTGKRRVDKPCIRSDRLTSSTLFKSKHAPCDFYCYEHTADPEREFKAFVETNKLTGLSFHEVMVS